MLQACTEGLRTCLTTKKHEWTRLEEALNGKLEERCAALADENERLHRELRELKAPHTPSGSRNGSVHRGMHFAEVSSPAPPVRRGSSSHLTILERRQESSQNVAAMAVAAASVAEATAAYQSSLVHVDVDNESDAHATRVTLRAPNRPYLLGDMTGAFSGLGLTVCQASIEAAAASGAATLHFALRDGGRKITESERLRAIEQRVQQRFRGRQGLSGGVRRLIVERFLRAEPPWDHNVLPSAPPASPDEASLMLSSLRMAIGPAGGTALGSAVPSVLAARCANELLPEMRRMCLPQALVSPTNRPRVNGYYYSRIAQLSSRALRSRPPSSSARRLYQSPPLH